MVLVPQSKAATAPAAQTQGPLPTTRQQLEHLVAERVDARPGGERVGGQHVQALHPVRHAAGGDARDLGTSPRRGPVGEIGAVRGGVRRRQHGIGGQPGLPLLHQAGPLEGADERGGARAGQVVRRGERRAVGQPRLGGDDVGIAARAPVPDRVDGPGLPAELGTDRLPRRRASITASRGEPSDVLLLRGRRCG